MSRKTRTKSKTRNNAKSRAKKATVSDDCPKQLLPIAFISFIVVKFYFWYMSD